MQNVHVKIKGLTPLLMHADNIEWADAMDEWNREPGNKASSRAGDDRTPAWRWLGSLNHDGNIVTVPSEYIMRCIMEGAAQVPTGRGKTTFKSQSQSGGYSQTRRGVSQSTRGSDHYIRRLREDHSRRTKDVALLRRDQCVASPVTQRAEHRQRMGSGCRRKDPQPCGSSQGIGRKHQARHPQNIPSVSTVSDYAS